MHSKFELFWHVMLNPVCDVMLITYHYQVAVMGKSQSRLGFKLQFEPFWWFDLKCRDLIWIFCDLIWKIVKLQELSLSTYFQSKSHIHRSELAQHLPVLNIFIAGDTGLVRWVIRSKVKPLILITKMADHLEAKGNDTWYLALWCTNYFTAVKPH